MIRERLVAHCDHCDAESQQHTCHEALLRNLRHNAWYVDARVMLCPDCYEFAVGWQQRIDSEWEAETECRGSVQWVDARGIPSTTFTVTSSKRTMSSIAAFVTSVQPMEEE